MNRLGMFVLALSGSLAGCASDDFEPLPGDVCAKQHSTTTAEGDEVVVCDALYTEAPFVHLPALDGGRVFAGIVGRAFVTAEGASYVASGMESEDKRHGVALYELALDGRNVERFKPVLEFDEAVFMAPFMGRSFEGVISPSTGHDAWADAPSLPVRVDVQAAPIDPPSAGTAYEARATLGNLRAGVTAADGSCLPSLESYGAEAPFEAGADVALTLHRVPSMHDFGDDHFVMVWTVNGAFEGTLMGPAWYRGPVDVLRGTLAGDAEYEGMGHGTPGTIPELTLGAAAVVAGDACDR